jgi:hypothetical protein
MRGFSVHRESCFVLQHSNVVFQLIISFIYSGKAKTKNLLKGLTSANCPSIRWLGSVSPLIDLEISPVLPPYLPQQHQLLQLSNSSIKVFQFQPMTATLQFPLKVHPSLFPFPQTSRTFRKRAYWSDAYASRKRVSSRVKLIAR